MVCALDYETGDAGSIPDSGGTTEWLFKAGGNLTGYPSGQLFPKRWPLSNPN